MLYQHILTSLDYRALVNGKSCMSCHRFNCHTWFLVGSSEFKLMRGKSDRDHLTLVNGHYHLKVCQEGHDVKEDTMSWIWAACDDCSVPSLMQARILVTVT